MHQASKPHSPFPDKVTAHFKTSQLTLIPTIFIGTVTASTDKCIKLCNGPRRRAATVLRRFVQCPQMSSWLSSLNELSQFCRFLRASICKVTGFFFQEKTNELYYEQIFFFLHIIIIIIHFDKGSIIMIWHIAKLVHA